MIKLVVMYPWPTDPVFFRQHYIERHLPLCRAIPGVVRSHYSFEPKTIQGRSKWFCIYEAEFVDEAALAASLATVEAEAASADVVNYSPEPPTALTYQLDPI